MWSIHDDIREQIKKSISLLSSEKLDLNAFNRFSAKAFFSIHTIIFREEFVLIPIICETFDSKEIDTLLTENKEIGYSFLNLNEGLFKKTKKKEIDKSSFIHLETGILTIKQLEMIFNHLPVDMTFVDKEDRVQFYSDQPHRIFPGTRSIIGRSVQNCHPPESIDVVNKIVEAFKRGEKNEASF